MNAVDAIRFGDWARSLGRMPMVDEVLEHCPGIDRATAYRRLAALREAWGYEHTGTYLRRLPAPPL